MSDSNKLMRYKKLKSGTDIRGVASDEGGKTVQLTDEAVYDLIYGFCMFLKETGIVDGARVSVGHDSRITAGRISAVAKAALSDFGFAVIDCGYASTPAMFMTTVDLDCDGAVQITASHHPFDRNGLKFFTKDGGLNGKQLDRIIEYAADEQKKASDINYPVETVDFMSIYSKNLRQMIIDGVNAEDKDHPLKGLSFCVDAGGGVGGFYANDVLRPLGADVSSSQFLEYDGYFKNHIPNPENKTAMDYLSKAVKNNHVDLGIIFDTDVDRAACTDENGNEINRNRLVALASVIALEDEPGGIIVTDSVTSTGLTDFIEKKLGGVHYRFKRGYRNVIDEQIRLESLGKKCPLAIETSGHASFASNYHLDDGAYLITRIVIKTALMLKEGKKTESLISDLRMPAEESEIRIPICTDDFAAYGNMIIGDMTRFAEEHDFLTLAPDNREGVRIFFDKHHGDGWLLLRLSVHDPIIPLNIESDSIGGCDIIKKTAEEFLSNYDKLDLSVFKTA